MFDRMEKTIGKYLSEEEYSRLASAGFGKDIGIGASPAVVVIDVQNYMAPTPDLQEKWVFPSSCGEAGLAAVRRIAMVLEAARASAVPVFYTQFVLKADGSDIGVYGRKRGLLEIEGWCLEGTIGAEFIGISAPVTGETVLVKKKPSAFFGTPLLSMLVDRGIDSLVVMGGSTSNCVRATVVDAMSYNFRTLVVEDGVFDRVSVSHEVALFDMQRQYADVVSSDFVIGVLQELGQ